MYTQCVFAHQNRQKNRRKIRKISKIKKCQKTDKFWKKQNNFRPSDWPGECLCSDRWLIWPISALRGTRALSLSLFVCLDAVFHQKSRKLEKITKKEKMIESNFKSKVKSAFYGNFEPGKVEKMILYFFSILTEESLSRWNKYFLTEGI